MLNASKVSGKGTMKKTVLDPGVYPGRLVGLVDLGLQEQRPYQGKDKPPANEVMATYELSDEFMRDEDNKPILDKPRWISETFVLHSLNAERATSTARYNALDPDGVYGGDFARLAGSPCNITIVVNAGRGKNAGKEYENVASVSAMRQKDVEKLPKLVNPTRVFDLDAPDLRVFMSLPDWVQEKIRRNLNYNGSKLQAMVGVEPVKSVVANNADDTNFNIDKDSDERPY